MTYVVYTYWKANNVTGVGRMLTDTFRPETKEEWVALEKECRAADPAYELVVITNIL